MKIKFITLCLMMIGAIFPLSATTRPGPCQFVFTGEWIYFHPLFDYPYFILENSSVDQDARVGSRKANDLSFHSGFRLEGMYGFSNCYDDIRISWTRLCTEDRQNQSGPFLLNIQGVPNLTNDAPLNGVATSKIDFTFNRVEGLFGRHLYHMCNLCFTVEAGLQYSSIEQDSRISSRGISGATFFTNNFDTKSCYWGIGPQIGLDASYQLCCFSINGTVSSALLLGESELKNNVTGSAATSDDIVDVKNDSIWRMVPNFQARLGLAYDFCCYCLNSNLEIGYEFLTYIRPLGGIIWPDVTFESQSFDLYSNVDFHGPYISLSIRY